MKKSFLLGLLLILIALLAYGAYDDPTGKTYYSDGLDHSGETFLVYSDAEDYYHSRFDDSIKSYIKVTNTDSFNKHDFNLATFYSEDVEINWVGEWKDFKRVVTDYTLVDFNEFYPKADLNAGFDCVDAGWLDFNSTHCYKTSQRSEATGSHEETYWDWKKAKAQSWQADYGSVPLDFYSKGGLAEINIGKGESKYFVLDYSVPSESEGEFWVRAETSDEGAVSGELDPGWFNSDWLKKRAIPFTNSVDYNKWDVLRINSVDMSGYAIQCADYNDVIVVDETNDIDLNRIVSCNGGATDCNIYFELSANLTAGAHNTQFYLYYDNAVCSTPKNSTCMGQCDKFEDGDYTSNPTFVIESGSYEIQSIAKDGSKALRISSEGYASVLRESITTNYQIWIRIPSGTYGASYRLYEGATIIAGGGIYSDKIQSYNGSYNQVESLTASPEIFYRIVLDYPDEEATFNITVFDANNTQIGQETGLSVGTAGTVDLIKVQGHTGGIFDNIYFGNGLDPSISLGSEESETPANATPTITLIQPNGVDGNYLSGTQAIVFDLNDTDIASNADGNLWVDIYYSASAGLFTNSIIADGNLFSDSFTCADTNFSDTTRCHYSWNTNTPSDGNYFIDINVFDDSDSNSWDSSDASFMVDNTDPTTTITDYNAGWQSIDQNIILSCSDTTSGCASTYYRIDSGTWISFDSNILFSTDGNYQLDYNSTDNTGNIETTNTTWVAIDSVNPTTTINDYNSGWQSIDQNIILSCADGNSVETSQEIKTGSYLLGKTSDTIKVGQKITINNKTITGLSFYLERFGNPAGDLNFSIYRASDKAVIYSELWGTASTISAIAFEWKKLTLTTPTVINEEVYLVVEYIGTPNADNYVYVGYNDGDILPNENAVVYVSSWAEQATRELDYKYFYEIESSNCSTTSYRIDEGAWTSFDSNIYFTDGNYQLDYNSTDNAGNIETTNTVWVAVNTGNPEITNVIPLADNYTNSTTVSFDVNDVSPGIADVNVRINGSLSGDFSFAGSCSAGGTGYHCSYVESAFAYGVNQLIIDCNDSAGFMSEETVDFNYNTAPAATVESPSDTNYLLGGQTTSIVVTTHDADNNTDTMLVDINYNTSAASGGTVIWNDNNLAGDGWVCDTNFLGAGSATCQKEWTVPALDGNYYIVFFIEDEQPIGDLNSTVYGDSFYIDSTAPETSMNDFNVNWQNTDQNIILSCSDSGAGCSATSYRIDGGAWTAFDSNIFFDTDGNFQLDFNSTDSVGNIETTNTTNISIDKTVPVISEVIPVNAGVVAIQAVSFDVNDVLSGILDVNVRIGGVLSGVFDFGTDCTDALSDNNYSCSYTETGIVGGANTIIIDTNDLAGNTAEATTTFTYGGIEDANVLDPNGVDGNYLGATNDATHGIRFEVQDIVGDLNISIYYSASAGLFSNAIVEDLNLLASDGNLNCEDTDFTDSTECTYTWGISGVADGNYFIDINVYSNSTDENSWDASDASFMIDLTAPTNGSIVITDTAGYTKDITPTLTLYAEDAGSGMKEMAFSCNNAAWSGWTAYNISHTSFNVTTGAGCTAGDGAKTIYTKFRDNVDNESASVNDSTYYDTTAPTTTLTGCDLTDWNASDQNCRLTCSDGAGAGCGTIYWQIDSGGWYSESVADTITFLVNTDGNHEIEFYSVDPLINTEANQTQWTAIDNTAPTTTSAGYTDYAWTADSVTVTLNCSDSHVACNSTQYRLDENPSETISMGAWQAYTVPFNITTDGNWAIDFNSTDSLGNVETPNREHILVSNPQFISDGLFWTHDDSDANFSFQLDENTWFYADWNIQTYSTIDSNAMHWMVWSQETNDTNHWKRSTLGGDINGWSTQTNANRRFDHYDTNTNTNGNNWFFKYHDFGRRAGSGGFITEQAKHSYFKDNTQNTDDLKVYRKHLVKIGMENVHIHAGHQTEYAIDLNLQFNSADPNQRTIGVYDCNSNYLTGNPTTSPNCYLAGTISSANPQSDCGYYSLYYATDSTGVFPNGTVPTADRNIVLYSDNTLSHSISVSAIVSDSSTKTFTSSNTGGSYELYNGTAQARLRWIHEDEPTLWNYYFTYHIQETGQDYNVAINSYTITIPPNQAPSVQINGVTDEWRTGTIDVNGACSDENIATMTIDLNIETQDHLTTTNIATGLTCLGGYWHTLFDTTTVADGNWELKATATDDEGLTSTAYADIAIDNSPPTVYIHSCDYSDWNSTNQTCSITCEDNGAGCNATTIGYRLDSSALDANTMGAWQTGTSFSFSADGKWRVDFNATDNLGNSQTDYNTAMITIDKTNPTLSDHQYATEVLTGDDSTPTFSVKVTDTNALAEESQAKGCWINVYKNSILVAQNQYDDINADGYCEYNFGAFPLSEDHWGFVTFKGTDNADNNSAPLTTATYNYNQEITDTGGVSPGGGGGGGATYIEEISQLLFSIIAPSPDKTIYVVLPKNSTKTVTITLGNDLTDRTVQINPTTSTDLTDFVEFDLDTLNIDANAQNTLTATFSWPEDYTLTDQNASTINGLFLFTTESKQETIPVKLVLAEENIVDILRNLLKQNLLLTIFLIMAGLILAIIPNTIEDLNKNIKSLAAVIGIIFTITIITLYLI